MLIKKLFNTHTLGNNQSNALYGQSRIHPRVTEWVCLMFRVILQRSMQ